jgi:hypothetical protein
MGGSLAYWGCEEVSVEIAQEEGLSPFAQVKYGFKEGTTTIFAGAKAGVQIEGSSWGASVKNGAYITFDSSGKATDVGMRVEGSISAGITENVSNEASVKVDISLADTVLQ